MGAALQPLNWSAAVADFQPSNLSQMIADTEAKLSALELGKRFYHLGDITVKKIFFKI